jgi:hypothetical protein
VISTPPTAFRKFYPNVKCDYCNQWVDSRECNIVDDWEPAWQCQVCAVITNLEGEDHAVL